MPWSYISEVDAFTIYHLVREDRSSFDDASFLDALGHAVAGASGTAISNVLVYPLDLVITRLQVQRKSGERELGASKGDDSHYDSVPDAVQKIYSNEGGLPAFYSGVVQDTLKSVADSFIFFLAYNLLQRARSRARGTAHRATLMHAMEDISIGVIAGALTKGLTAPAQQIVTRKQIAAMASASSSADHKPHVVGREMSVRQIVQDIYQARGILGFWSGYSASIVLTLNPSLTFYIDSFMRRVFSTGESSGGLSTFLLAATGKALASSITYPVSLAKARAQAASASADQRKPELSKRSSGSVLAIIPEIARRDGVTALYAGLAGEVFKGFFSHGLTMLVKQRIHSLVIRLYFWVLELVRRSRNISNVKLV